MKKRGIIYFLIGFLVVIGALICLIYSIRPLNYGTAKSKCEAFLERNRGEMEEIAISLLNGEGSESGYYKEEYYFFTSENDKVEFDIGGQGMLGGQYWGLVYTKNGLYCGETKEYLYKELGGGNNIIRAEKLDDHWWYLWYDYDGTERSYK